MGLLSAAMKAELQKTDPQVYAVMEVDYPDGTKRYSKAGVNSATLGNYLPDVLQFGSVEQKLEPGQTTLAAISAQAQLFDRTGEFADRVGKGQKILNSAVRYFIASPNVAQASWAQSFGGLLYGWDMSRPKTWTLKLQTPEVRLQTLFPRYQTNKFDFPNMDKGALGTHGKVRKVTNTVQLGNYTPLIYGKHDDWGDQSGGAVPCPLIDTVGFRNLVSIGMVKVLRVYTDGALAPTSSYSIAYPIINGRQYTLIDWNATHNTQVITADVEGYDTVGDLSGSLIIDPMSVLQHIITNFCLNDYSRGLWLPTDATFFDTAVLAATRTDLNYLANGAAYVSARYISAQLSGLQAVNELCASMQLVPYWTDQGRLAVRRDNHNLHYPASYPTDPIVHWEQMKTPTLSYSGSRQARRVIATFENIAAGGSGSSTSNTIPKEYYQLEVRDPLSTSLTDEQLSLNWGPSTYP